MTIPLPQLGPHPTGEVHTSELTCACPRQAFLRLHGRGHGLCEGALFKGLLFGEVLERWHAGVPIDRGVLEGVTAVFDKLKAEGRTPSAPVVDNQGTHANEIQKAAEHYAERFGDYFAKCEIIGTEVPCRLTLDVDWEPVNFASHIDLIFKGPDPRTSKGEFLHVIDWKFRKDSPSPFYLARNLQLGLYALCVDRGELLVDGEWVTFGAWPRSWWLDGASCKPYARKTIARDDDGEQREFKKGDARPQRSVLIEAPITKPDAVIDALSERVRMMRDGHWPAIPSPDGCRFCDVAHACPSFGSVGLEGCDG